MNTLWFLLLALGCPLGMAAMLWLMLRPQSRRIPARSTPLAREVEAIRAQPAAWLTSEPGTDLVGVGPDQ